MENTTTLPGLKVVGHINLAKFAPKSGAKKEVKKPVARPAKKGRTYNVGHVAWV